ncbi:MAG: PAS domain S-box protein [Proteobacteria bacterium]|nr:PAS domain S-box protein [Pseudomonadota bacterium]
MRAANMAADLAQLIDTANAPIFGIDVEGKINEWNQTAERITGFTKDDVMGHDLVAEFITEEYRAPVKEVLDKALRGEETSNFEFPLYSKAGERVDVLLNSTTRRDVAGNIVGVIGIGQDITERKRWEAALTESEARYRDIVDNAQVLIQSVDPDEGRFVFTNRAWQETLGYGPDEVPALGMADVIHPDSMDHCMKVLQEVLKGKPVGNIQATFVSKDGRNVELEGSVICRRNEDGTRTTHSVFTDVTDRKLAEAQVIQAAKLATLGEMATSVAHELNQPLNVIRMAAGNVLRKLEKGKADPTYLNDKLERIASQTERAAAIIDHMRMFGRKADEKPHELDPCDAVEGALHLMGEQLRLAQIEVVTDLSKTCRPVLGHPLLMEQVILNLLTNARDAIQGNPADGGGKITLAAGDGGNEWVRITVSDNGGGIPEKALGRIFEPFFTTKKMGEGTGLGLSVSYGIIRDMGGTIEAENADGGAKFTITLPVAGTDAEKGRSDAV